MKKRTLKMMFFFTAAIAALAVFGAVMLSSNKYDGLIYKYAGVNSIDPVLVKAIIKAESNFNAGAVSRRGAVGLMQLMPATAADIARRLNLKEYKDDFLFDPEVNIMFGTYYIKMLLNIFQDNLNLSLAAYNAGMGNVEKWRYENPIVDFESNEIPFNETKKYVRNIKMFYKFYSGAEKLRNLIKLKKH